MPGVIDVSATARRVRRAALATIAALAVTCAAAAPTALAGTQPSPGSPGPQYSPPLTAATFSDPGAALRPKYRWWQPVADTGDAQIRSEVDSMAADGGGGFEQNGFPVTMNAGGATLQFETLGDSQEFNRVFGWGSAAWSDRTAAYQSQAASDGVIGDMNEGSRWNNSVPSVDSQNDPGAAQQIVFGDAQLQPGQTPSGQLPPAIQNRSYGATSGVSTTLCRTAQPGDRTLQLDSVAGLRAGDAITLGAGPGAESATIAHVGTPSPCVGLSQPARAGDRVVHVALTHGDIGLTANAVDTTTALSATTGVLGTAMLPAQYRVGERVTIGAGAEAQADTITAVGTDDAAAPTTLAADAPQGTTNVLLDSTAGFLTGDTITIDAGRPDGQTATITAVGEPGIGTALAQAASGGDTGLRLASTSGLAAGNQIVIDPGAGDAQTARIASVDPSAAAPADNVLLDDATVMPSGFPAGTTVRLAHLGVSFTPALSAAATAGATVTDTGTGITLDRPLDDNLTTGTAFMADGSGVRLTAPLARAHNPGPDSIPQTTLVTQADAGTDSILVASSTGIEVGDTITIGSPGYTEAATVSAIGRSTIVSGTAQTPITLAQPLSTPHFGGDPVLDDATRDATTTLDAPAPVGATDLKVASVTGLSPGDRIVIGDAGDANAGDDEIATIASGGVGTPGPTGTGVTITKRLTDAHPTGERLADDPAAQDSAGLSDVATRSLIGVVLVQCEAGDATSCPASALGGTRELDASTAQVVTADVSDGRLHYPGALPQGNGNPWEEVALYQTADGQTLYGATATSPDYWLDHLSASGARAMADYFDGHILNNPATAAAIRYQDTHTGTPAVFEDSLELSPNIKWTSGMLTAWRHRLGYDPVALLPAIVGNNSGMTNNPLFEYPDNDGHGASLGWRVREDYRQMWNDLYVDRYMHTLDRWASAHGLVTRFQSYGNTIDEGQAAANSGIPEGEHLEFTGNDETQQFKVVASGAYQSGNRVVSDECCEEIADAWADTFGVDGTGTGPEGSSILSNANSAYADVAGGDTQIVWHGWPYTTGAAGSPALWPGSTYGGDASFSAANGPNQPQFADDRSDNLDLARLALALRQGEPSFDVAVYHQDLGLDSEGSDDIDDGEYLGDRVDGGVPSTPTTGKLIKSSSSLAQDGYTYGYVSPTFFAESAARYAVDPGDRDPAGGARAEQVLFPGHGDYRALVLYDQSVLPVTVARKILELARQGLPVVVIGSLPDATASADPGTVAGFARRDAQVQKAMAALARLPNVDVVPDSTATGSQSADANAPAALQSFGIGPTTALSTTVGSGTTAQPVLTQRRHVAATDTDIYYLFNPDLTATVSPTVTLTGSGTPYRLDTWSGGATAIAGWSAPAPGRVRLAVRIAPGNFALVAISRHAPAGATPAPALHAVSTTADATPAWSADVTDGVHGTLEARAAHTGTYTTTLSSGRRARTHITVPALGSAGNALTLTDWQLSVDGWGPTPSGDPTQTAHAAIPASGTLSVQPLAGSSDGALPSWTQITPQNGFPVADDLVNVAGIGTYTTSFTLPADWSRTRDGAYLNLGVAVDTVQVTVNGHTMGAIDQNDRDQIDLGPDLRAGTNTLRVQVATPLRNAVRVAPATPQTGQMPNSAEPIGALQGGSQEANMGLIGPVVLTPYAQARVG